jgi:hypothetical protein
MIQIRGTRRLHKMKLTSGEVIKNITLDAAVADASRSLANELGTLEKS